MPPPLPHYVLLPPSEYFLTHIPVLQRVLCLPAPFLSPSQNNSSSSKSTNCFSKLESPTLVSLAILFVRVPLLPLPRMVSHVKTFNYLDVGKAMRWTFILTKFINPSTSKNYYPLTPSYSHNHLPSALWACPNPTYRDIRPMACRDLQRDSREGVRFAQFKLVFLYL